MRDRLEQWHRTLARVAGQISLTLERRLARKSDLSAWADSLAETEKEIRDAAKISEGVPTGSSIVSKHARSRKSRIRDRDI
jgi:hypothetical protein